MGILEIIGVLVIIILSFYVLGILFAVGFPILLAIILGWLGREKKPKGKK